MEKNELEPVTTYISKCPVCTIATVSTDGDPSAAIVFFSNIGADIYFNTAKDSQKIRNIMANPRVAIAMQETSAPKTDQGIKGIQYSGRAKVLPDAEIAEAPKAVMARHIALNSVNQGSSVVVKVMPTKIFFIDYSKGMRHRDLLQF
jgi:nitroimidazol reductase NimA-like FMN-containing flavoprotein (pyridoxamine 5'-phosphate oxidase superfamily)